MKINSRYSGEPKRLYDFMDNFSVHCPKCNRKAEVHVSQFLDYKNALLTCKSCHFSEKRARRTRYILTGKAKCAYCLEWLNLQMDSKNKIPKFINIRCTCCQKINKVNENWTEISLPYNTEGILDPAFGLHLWYKDFVKGDVIWSYNMEHLQEIKAYVAAKLRERSTSRFKMTMVEKLPEFIKLAKNREEVLKALERMETK